MAGMCCMHVTGLRYTQQRMTAGVTLRLGPLSYLFRHSKVVSGGWCLGVFDNGHQGTLLGGITFRNVLVTVRPPTCVAPSKRPPEKL